MKALSALEKKGIPVLREMNSNLQQLITAAKIQTSGFDTYSRSLSTWLGCWLKQQSPLPPTWKSLLGVLREISLGHLANQIDTEVLEESSVVSLTSGLGESETERKEEEQRCEK